MAMDFYAGTQAPELSLGGRTHEHLEPLLTSPMLSRLLHWYDEDTEYSLDDVRLLASEARAASEKCVDPDAKRFLANLAGLAFLANERSSGIRVVRD